MTSASLALLILAVIPIWVGSFVSLRMMKKSSQKTKLEQDDAHVLSTQHALVFPIIGSIAIFYTYLALKSIDPEYINEGIIIVTSLLSTALFSNTLLLIAKNNMSRSWLDKIENYKFSFSRQGKEVCHIHITTIHLLVMAASIALSVTYAITQHWIIGNMFTMCLVINIIGFLTVDSFWTGFFLMCGMLIHDILWISGSETIVKISESFSNAPLNIIWPRHIETFVLDQLVKDNQMFTMFSITDIIIPGIFIAYFLRFDRKRAWEKNVTNMEFDKPFFNSAIVAYTISAGVSIITVHLTKNAQSALFYIMPALTLSTLFTAVIENNLKEVTTISPVIESLEKLNFLVDRDERPQRFKPRSESSKSKSRSKSKKSVNKPRSTSKAKRTRSQSKTRGRPKNPGSPVVNEKVPSTEVRFLDKAHAALDEQNEAPEAQDNEMISGRTQRVSSRISRRRHLEDYV
ncbi:hypothetical protein G6F56_002514 [Rhizopus delemar]|nr:hypothetical protein G6F56_002514 [Rhizopus delemar]